MVYKQVSPGYFKRKRNNFGAMAIRSGRFPSGEQIPSIDNNQASINNEEQRKSTWWRFLYRWMVAHPVPIMQYRIRQPNAFNAAL